jgi:RNA-directed DNA polymerase
MNEGKTSAIVATTPKQAEEAQGGMDWVEPSVWTPRMLAALQNGVKGGLWFSLIDKVYSAKNLEAAFRKVKGNRGAAGIDRVSVAEFERRLPEQLDRIRHELQEGTYQPRAIRRVYIDKPGRKEKRPLGIPTVRDRVVQTALRQVIEPIFEREFAPHSYGFRPRRGCKDALREVQRCLDAGKLLVVDTDISKCFESIPHERLMTKVKRRIADQRVLKLIEQLLRQGVLEELSEWAPEKGTPQGSVISPLLANIYLNDLDHQLSDISLVRYADDLVVLCRTEDEAKSALETLAAWMTEAELRLHPDKTRIVDMRRSGNSFEFLGYRFARQGKRVLRQPRRQSLERFKNRVRQLTPRTSGRSLNRIIAELNPVLRGWFGYYKHSRWRLFKELDQWIRIRLRTVLRQRHKRKGLARGADYLRWPNYFFASAGLYSLLQAHAAARQSAAR